MNTRIVSSLRTLAVAASLLSLATIVSAKPSTRSDAAAEQLARVGVVSLKSAGPYVEIGTFAVQVSTKLGRPNFSLADGTWLYEKRGIDGSNAKGTLVVRFTEGRVSELSLVSPAVAMALRSPAKNPERSMIATKN